MFSSFPGEGLGRRGWGWKEMVKVGRETRGKRGKGKRERRRGREWRINAGLCDSLLILKLEEEGVHETGGACMIRIARTFV